MNYIEWLNFLSNKNWKIFKFVNEIHDKITARYAVKNDENAWIDTLKACRDIDNYNKFDEENESKNQED